MENSKYIVTFFCNVLCNNGTTLKCKTFSLNLFLILNKKLKKKNNNSNKMDFQLSWCLVDSLSINRIGERIPSACLYPPLLPQKFKRLKYFFYFRNKKTIAKIIDSITGTHICNMQEEDARFLKRFVFWLSISCHFFCRTPIIKMVLLLKRNRLSFLWNG